MKWRLGLVYTVLCVCGLLNSANSQHSDTFGNDNSTSRQSGDQIVFLDPVTGLPTDLIILETLCSGEVVDFCFDIESSSFDHNITGFSGNIGEVVVAPFSAPSDSCFSYTAPFGFTGNDTILFEVTNFIGTVGEVEVVYTITDPSTPIDAGPTEQLCSETTGTLSAVNPDPLAEGTWILFSGGGTITDPNSPTTTVN